MKLPQRLFVLVVVPAILFMNAQQVKGQAGIEMELSATYKFGEQVTFVAQIQSPVQIQSASIVIFDQTLGVTHIQPVTFNAEGVSAYRLDAGQNSLHPFTTLLWHYDLTLTDGSTVQGPSKSIRYDDDRFSWQTLESGAVRVHWYDGDHDFGVAALSASTTGLQMITEFFPPDLTQPVDIFIYANADDLRGTLYDSADSWVAGHADAAAGVIMVTVEPGANYAIQMEQRIPHELMHVMLYRQIGAGTQNIPAWLREGISVLAETYPNPDYNIYLMDAGRREALIPIRDLCASFSPNSDSAFLAYAESRSFVNYLRGLYGSDGLMNLARIYAGGVSCERGTERAFGVSLAKLEMDWHNSVLGQNSLFSSFESLIPYFALLCLVVFVPFVGMIGAMRRKGDAHGSRPSAR